MTTPFATVTFFEPDKTIQVSDMENYGQLEEFLGNHIETKNIFYAMRIEGDFALPASDPQGRTTVYLFKRMGRDDPQSL